MEWITAATAEDWRSSTASLALLPVGSFEQHGGHLPLATDTAVAAIIVARLADRYDAHPLPPIPVSCSHEHAAWRGTVSISATTLWAVVADIRASLAAQGVDRLAIISGHGGNYVLSNLVQQANAGLPAPRVTLYPGRDEWAAARRHGGLDTDSHQDMHAGELETSILLHAAPELVGDGYRTADHEADSRPHLLLTGLAGYTENGVIGRPSAATADKGAAVLDSLVEQFTTHFDLLSR